MEKTTKLFYVIFFFTTFLQLANSWGYDGHQIVGQIAQNFLTDTTSQNLQPYLNGFTLANISTWPDYFRATPQGAWTETLHYANVPIDATEFEIEYCAPEFTNGFGCVVTAIANYTSILATDFRKGKVSKCMNDANEGVEPCALSFLTHFVGDVHQPLHVSYAEDDGGNLVNIDFNNQCTSLHGVWDYSLIEFYESATNLNWYDIAQLLSKEIEEVEGAAEGWSLVMKSSLWANESFEITRLRPYNFQPGSVSMRSDWVYTPFPNVHPKRNLASLLIPRPSPISSCGPSYYVLGVSYYSRNIPLIFEQMMKAGVRLATHLNVIFDPSFKFPVSLPHSS